MYNKYYYLGETAARDFEEADRAWQREQVAMAREAERHCPRCGEPLTDECDPDFCEACFQDYPMTVACWDTHED